MPTPKISVIIPIYNVEKYLDKCLESVRQQMITVQILLKSTWLRINELYLFDMKRILV